MLLLEVKDLSICFGDTTVVDKLSFQINTGETLGVVGESGSGKTLTGLAIMGLLPLWAKVSGQINFYSENQQSCLDLINLPENQKEKIRGKNISIIFQEPMTALNPVVRCGNQVNEILKIHTTLSNNDRKSKVVELFEETSLQNPREIYYKYPHQLSGGQQQRVMIAMAIACNPQLLIADEPTTALDVSIQHEIIDLLIQLKKKHNLSVLFISHDLGIISKVSDNIIVLNKGKLVESGTTDKIFNFPVQNYTKGLILCRPRPNERLIRLPVVEDFISGEGILSTEKENLQNRKLRHAEIYSIEPFLILKNINSYFSQHKNIFENENKKTQVLKDIDLKIWKGETLGLVGESGSGKTTLGRVIMHLVETSSGQIFHNGLDISKLEGRELKQFRKKVQLIFQDPYSALSPNQTIGKSIMEPMLVQNIFTNNTDRIEKTVELMMLTGLNENWFNRYPHQLSGGQRQRVVIARALALQPELLICDESVSALDVSVQAQVLNLLNELKQKLNLTYLFISHDLAVIKYMSDRILVMQNGEIIESAEADELYANPKLEYTKTLISKAFI